MKNLTQKLISFALVITMFMGVATLPAFASTYPDTQSSNALSWYVSWQGTSRSITRGQSIANILASMARWLDSDAEALYNRMGGLSSDIQDVVDAIGAIPGATDYSTVLSSIDSKVKDYTNNFASVENKLQSMINNIININTGLSTINTTLGTGSSTDNIFSRLSSIDDSTSGLIDEYKNTQQISTPIQERSTVTGTLTATSKTTPLLVRFLSRSGNSPYKTLESVNGTLTLYDYFHILNNNLIGVNTALVTTGTSYNYRYYNDDMTTGTRTVASVMDMLMNFSGDMSKFVSRMSYMIADPDTVAAKQANKLQEQSVLDNFTGSGDASASVSDFVGVKDSVSALKTSLSGGASYTQAFNILGGNSDGWSWFTTEVAESMDTTGNGSTRRGSVPVSTPYLDSYYDSIYSVIGINGGIE